MRFGSVCSGIEAASVAWHPLAWRAAWFSEIEPFPCAVLAHHYPEVPNHGDMTALPQLIRGGKVEAPDLFCGGTPCQAFSVAGLRRSLDDERGNLSLTFVEIADAIDDVRRARGDAECIVFWENVPGVLSTQDNAFGCFLGALAGCDTAIEPLAATGWTDAGVVAGPQRTVAWRVLDAQYFGLAQRRRRVFVVASARADFDPAAVLLEWEGLRRDSAPSREAREGAARGAAGGAGGDVVGALYAGCGPNGHGGSGLATLQGAVQGHLQAFGGNRTSGSIDITPALLAQPGSGWKGDFESETFVTHSRRGEGFDASEDGTGRGTPLVPVAFAETAPTLSVGAHGAAGHPHRQHGNETAIVGMTAWRCPDCGHAQQYNHRGCRLFTAHAFDARQSDVLQYGDKTGLLDTDGRSVAVAFTQNSRSEVREIGGDGQIVGALAADSGAQQQNYVAQAVLAPTLTATNDPSRSPQSSEITAQVAAVVQAMTFQERGREHGRELEIGGDVAYALTAPNGGGRAQERNVMTPAMQVRRLTPRECERLQGFSDDYTAIPWRGKPASECPDGPRYKALGNSWAVPCVRWIGRRIAAQIA